MHTTMERMCLSSLLSSFLSSFWQPYYFVVAIDIFDRHIFFYRHISVKFDGHHPMLMVCQTIKFAIVFFSFCIAWLKNTWRYTYNKYGWNAGEYNGENYMQIKSLSSFLSSHLTAIFLHSNSFLLSTFETELRFFYRHFWTDNWNSTVIFGWQTTFNTENPIVCYVFLAKRSWIRTKIHYYVIISTQ